MKHSRFTLRPGALSVLLTALCCGVLRSPAHAQTAFPPGGTAAVSLSAAQTSMTYTFTVAADADTEFTFSTSAGLSATLTFYDVDGASAINSVSVNGGRSGTVGILHLGPGGVYYVTVSQNSGAGSVTISNTTASNLGPNDIELDDDKSKANAMPINNSTSGHLGYSRGSFNDVDYVDWHKVTTTQDGTLTVSLSDTAGLGTSFSVYDANGTNALTSAFVAPGAANSVSLPHVGANQTYFVVVYISTGNGSYTLSSSQAPAAGAGDGEPNDTLAQAGMLPLNGSASGRLGFSRTAYSDVDSADWYKVTTNSSGDLSVSVANGAGLADALAFYRADGSLLTASGGIGAGANGSISLARVGPNETYYLLVNRTSGYGDYTLASSLSAPLTGTIVLDGLAANAVPQDITIKFHPHDNSGDFTRTVSIDAHGTFTLYGLPRNTYDLSVKGAKWLRVAVNNVALSAAGAPNINALLPGGDADNNNVVDIVDFGILVNAYGSDSSLTSSGYDSRADFNSDGIVDIADFGILVNNYGRAGAS